MQQRFNPFLRSVYLLEPLERRYFLAIAPIDLTAGVPFDGLVATNLRLPAYATGHDMLNVGLSGNADTDYTPRAVVHADGTFDLYARFTPQRSGTGEMLITFRNDDTGGWDTLEVGEQMIKLNHFESRFPGLHIYDRVPGTKYREALVTFDTTSLTRSLDEYVVEVDWFGQTLPGRLVSEHGSVSVYVDAYLPLNTGESVSATIRLADAAPDAAPVGYARAYMGVYSSMGIGMFYGGTTSETDFRINLPNTPPNPPHRSNMFTPTVELEGWTSTFRAELIWQYRDRNVANSDVTLVRYSDGRYALVGQLLPGVLFDNGMFRIFETVQRPAIGDMPAQTYTLEYVGSFDISSIAAPDTETPVPAPRELPAGTPTEQPTETPTENPAEVPTGGGGVESPTGSDPDGFVPIGTGGMIILVDGSRFSALSSGDGFDPLVSSLFRTVGDNTLADDEEETEIAALPA